jgi:CheY-like chemotaxis protein
MEILKDKIIVVAASYAASRDAVIAEFSGHGCQVLPVTGSYEAYEVARMRHVDAVIASCRLSSGDVRLLLSDIRRLNHDTPVVLFGAAGENITQTDALHLGFAAFFPQTLPTGPLAAATRRSLEFVAERKKKKVERVAVAAQVKLMFGSPPQNVEVKAPVLNLSRGGLFISMDNSFPPLHSEVMFSLTFPPEVPHPTVEGRALVRWVREHPASGHLPGVGLEYVEISPEAQAFLNGYVERASARSKI